MEVVEEWEGEEEYGGLKVRSREGKMENPEAEKGAVQVEELGDSESCVYLDKDKGIECAYEITGTKFCSVRLFIDEEELGNDGADFETKTLETQNDLPFIGDHGSPKQMKDEDELNSSMVFSERQCEDGTAKFEPIKDKSGTNASGSLVDAGKIVVEMDVEKVLEEQETHDLFCPNCNSCITKRVILRKRERIVADLPAAECEEIQPILPSGVEASPNVANDPINKTGTYVFRCLSCLSFFIPKGLITSETPVKSVPTVDTRIVMPKGTVEDAATRQWDILKSIVYGGLAESIASLGVVSSAAGSDATTLNIVALGVANLITGLLVIIHNLRELKNEQLSPVDQDGERLDRYQATLGRREKFWLHATVSVSSYLLFGLLPPVIYGFSFRKSDNREYKLIAVAAASLLCIILLAAGKAHVRKAPKNYIRTILYHVGIGVTASGLSYAVGVLFEKLLEKLGWLDSGAATPVSSNLAFPEMVATKSRWASY